MGLYLYMCCEVGRDWLLQLCASLSNLVWVTLTMNKLRPYKFMVWCNYLTGDQLAIGKETGRRLGMGSNMYPSSSLLGQHRDESLAALPIDELIEKADGFAGVFPGYYLFKDWPSVFEPVGVHVHATCPLCPWGGFFYFWMWCQFVPHKFFKKI